MRVSLSPVESAIPPSFGPPSTIRVWAATVIGVLLACGGGDSSGPDTPQAASVVVTSNIGAIIDVGGTAQLTAVARTSGGQVVPDISFTWSSSNGTVASVAGGVVSGVAPGTTILTATTPSSVQGSLNLQVVQADLPLVTALQADAFAATLIAALTAGSKATAQSAWTECGSGVSTGNITEIKGCVDAVQSSAAAAIDPTDRVLLAVLALYANEIERLI